MVVRAKWSGLWGAVLTALVMSAGNASAAVIYDGDGDISRLTGVGVTISGVTTVYDVYYQFGTFDAVNNSPLATGAWWAYEGQTANQRFNWMSAAINAIADELDAQGVSDAQFTNGLNDGGGSANGLVAYDFGTITTGTGTFGCVTCIQTRGVWWTNSASGWSPDGGTTFVLTTTNEAFEGPEVTWAVFVPVSSVPLPAAAWLFGSALMSLLGAAVRKERASH
jgi:hypothetical protein